MKLIIIRHGDPDYSVDNLTQKGKVEAELLKARLIKTDINAIYCSPYGRAQATAEPYLSETGKTAIILDWLKEFPARIFDVKQGREKSIWDQMPNDWTNTGNFYDKEKWLDTPLAEVSNAKSEYEKVCKGLDELLKNHGYVRENMVYRAENPNCDTVVLFCHFGVECVMLSHLLGISPMVLWHGFVALPTSVTTLITEEREEGTAYFRCNGFGDLSHLYAADEPPAFAARFCEVYTNKDERH